MPAFHRSFNPYSSAPPPPASLPHYIIPPSTIEPLTNEQAGALIDSFLQTQNGKILTLHRLADHLLGRTQLVDDGDIKELEDLLEEERRREGGVVHVVPEDVTVEEIVEETKGEMNQIPNIETDKKRARKEERRMKKETQREKRKAEENQHQREENVGGSKESKKLKKDKEHKASKKN
jgi:hypothetical protein